jgi:AraC family L-rhamnose operon regulatory protein RhaS
MLKIIIMEEGSAILNVAGKTGVVSAPAVFCLNEHENLQVVKSDNLSIKGIYFDPYVINNNFNYQNIYGNLEGLPEIVKLDHFYFMPFVNRNNNSGMIPVGSLSVKRMSTVFSAIKNLFNKTDDYYWPCRCRSYLIEMLFLIQHFFSLCEESGAEIYDCDAEMNEIMLYLHLNYMRKITIDDLIERFHTNRNTLNKRFKKNTGVAAMEYIIRLRLKISCMLLRDTKLPVSEIMQRAGFCDASYFGRAFRRFTGQTPTGYRIQKSVGKGL